MTTEDHGSQGDQFVTPRRSTGQIIMEQAEVVEGVVDAPPESQPACGVLVAQSILHVTEETSGAGNEPWTIIHQEFDATISPTSSFETAESQ
jgi:hypothetical protein